MSVEDDLFKKLRRLVENTKVVRPMRMKVRRPPAQARRRGRSRRSRRRVASRGRQWRDASQAIQAGTWTCYHPSSHLPPVALFPPPVGHYIRNTLNRFPLLSIAFFFSFFYIFWTNQIDVYPD